MSSPDTTSDDQAGPITREQVQAVARLARLTLTADELDTYTGQLAAVLDHAKDVEDLRIDDVAPMSHPYPLVNVLRPDEVAATLDRAEVLAQAPSVEDDRFRVPAILGEEP